MGLGANGVFAQDYRFLKQYDISNIAVKINDILVDNKNDMVWVATGNGLASIQNDEVKWHGELSQNNFYEITALYLDGENNLWLGTNRSTVIRLNTQRKIAEKIDLLVYTNNSLHKVMTLGSNGQKTWFGLTDGTIITRRKGSLSNERIPSPVQTPVYAISLDDREGNYVATDDGNYFASNSFSWQWRKEFHFSAVNKFLKTGGRFFVIGKDKSNKAVLLQREGKKHWHNHQFNSNYNLPSYTVFHDIDIGTNHFVWIAAAGGVVRYDTQSKECMVILTKQFPELIQEPLTQIAYQDDNHIWVGTETKGLFVLTKDSPKPVKKETPKPKKAVVQEKKEQPAVKPSVPVIKEPKPEPVTPNTQPATLHSKADLDCQKKLILPNLIFQRTKDVFMNEEKALIDLNILLEYLKEHPQDKIELHGHTDYGQAVSLKELSQKRVDKAKQFLLDNGISSYRIITFSHGGSMPLTKSSNVEEKKKNRRVEAIVICK